MAVLPAQTIRDLCLKAPAGTGLISPYQERGVFNGMTAGLGPCTYDFRIKQTVVLLPLWQAPLIPIYRLVDRICGLLRVAKPFVNVYCSFALASTVERVTFPNDVCGTVLDKSSWARRGLAVQNTKFDPGFHGYPTIELSNHSLRTIVIEEGSPICQFKFERLEEPTQMPYAGRYLGQGDEPTPYRPAKDTWG